MRQASFATAEHESPALQLSKCVHGGTTGSGCGHLVTELAASSDGVLSVADGTDFIE
jgi:hypothetical protein